MPPLGRENVVERALPKIDKDVEQQERIHERETQIATLMTCIIPPAEKRRFRPVNKEARSSKAYYPISEDDFTHHAAWLERDRSGKVRLFTEVYEQLHPESPERYYRTSGPQQRVMCYEDGYGLFLEESKTRPRWLPYSDEYEAVVDDIRDTLLLIQQAQTTQNIGAVAANEYYEAWMISAI